MQYIQEVTDSEAERNQATDNNDSTLYDQKLEQDPEEPNVIETESKQPDEPPPKSKEDENDDNDKSVLNVEDLLDDDCHEVNPVFKDEIKIDELKPVITPVDPHVKGEGQVKDAETDTPQTNEHACCDYKAKYDQLLRQHERAGDQLRTVSSNLELVTRQLVTRDGDMMDYMDTVSHLFNLVSMITFICKVHTLDCVASPQALLINDLFRAISRVQNPLKFNSISLQLVIAFEVFDNITMF